MLLLQDLKRLEIPLKWNCLKWDSVQRSCLRWSDIKTTIKKKAVFGCLHCQANRAFFLFSKFQTQPWDVQMAAVGANEWKGGFVRSTGGTESNSFLPTTMESDSYLGKMGHSCHICAITLHSQSQHWFTGSVTLMTSVTTWLDPNQWYLPQQHHNLLCSRIFHGDC